MDIENITLEEYRELLRFHDWYFSYADDSRAYEKGQKERVTLRLALTSLESRGFGDEARILFNEISPKEFSV